MTLSGLYKGKNPPRKSAGESDVLRWVPAVAAGGGLLLALVALKTHQRDLAIGLGWGGVLTVFNYYSLKMLTKKVLSRGEAEGRKFFWLWNAVRWIFLSAACWFFLSISPLCLAGAGVSYLWFLVVLGFTGWYAASQSVKK